jgi:hypothetical protein
VFRELARSRGGAIDLSKYAIANHEYAWIAQFVSGFQSLTAGYRGFKNKLGGEYISESGVFANDDFNGTADKIDNIYRFGISLGVLTRLFHAHLLLNRTPIGTAEISALAHVLGGQFGDLPPADYKDVMDDLRGNETSVLDALRLTFYSVGFVWMHEAFHTLIGHTDLARHRLNFSLDEMSLPPPGSHRDEVYQCLELGADGAAISNFTISAARDPTFGVQTPRKLTPSERAADVAISTFLSLAALEWQRSRLPRSTETRHPLPSRRFVSAKRLLATIERHGGLPTGAMANVERRAKHFQEAFRGSPVATLIDMVAGDRPISSFDADRLSYLIGLNKAELTFLNDTSFAPRVNPDLTPAA